MMILAASLNNQLKYNDSKNLTGHVMSPNLDLFTVPVLLTQAQTVNSKSLCTKLGCSRRRERQVTTNSALIGVRYKNITSTATSFS
jgi:hypothetical protein